MELLDRYLKAVGKCLPEAQREDILKEIADDIRSEIEEREAELGRPLTEVEQEALLKKRGNPVLLASRYREGHGTLAFGRQLIGPALFPFYIKVLSFNLGLTFVVVATIFAALAAGGHRVSFHDILSTCLLQLFIQLSVVTLIFSLIDKHLTTHPESWNVKGSGGFPLDLNLSGNAEQKAARRSHQVSRMESVSIIIASAVALVWLREVQRHPFLIFGPAAYFLKLAPVWYQVYWPIVGVTLAEMARAAVNLFRPDWTRLRAVSQVAIHSAGLVIVFFLLRGGHWVAVADTVNGYARAVGVVNQAFFYGLLIAGVISAVQLLIRIGQLIRGERGRGGRAAAPAA
jgi:hypothetical protein